MGRRVTTATEFIHKSEKLADIGKDAGWETKIIPEISGTDITWNVYFTRKPEAMKVVYFNNRLAEAVYTCGDKITTPAHKAAVVKILLNPQPDLTRLNGASLADQPRNLPFDPDDVMPSRILDTLLGKKITWLSSLTTELESERIEPSRNRGSRYYRIVRTADGRRYVEFITANAFRAVYLDAIISVH